MLYYKLQRCCLLRYCRIIFLFILNIGHYAIARILFDNLFALSLYCVLTKSGSELALDLLVEIFIDELTIMVKNFQLILVICLVWIRLQTTFFGQIISAWYQNLSTVLTPRFNCFLSNHYIFFGNLNCYRKERLFN